MRKYKVGQGAGWLNRFWLTPADVYTLHEALEGVEMMLDLMGVEWEEVE